MAKGKVYFSKRFFGLVIAISLTTGCMILSGCGAGDIAPPSSEPIHGLAGHVHGGQQPVTGSHVALFAASTGGYGAAISPLATAKSDDNGDFTFSSPAACTTGQEAYAVATGGNPGLSGTVDNSAIFLVAVVGPCPISTTQVIDINEVTTVIAAYALNGFVPAGGVGFDEASVEGVTPAPTTATMAGIGTTTTNTQGLLDGFNNALAMESVSYGTANTTTTNGYGVVPQATINELADILQTCVNTNGASNCTTLFTDTTPPGSTTKPANVFQAAVNIARYPGNNVAGIFGTVSTVPAFLPNLGSNIPNDFTLGIVYNNSQISSALGMSIDASDNVWVSGSLNADLLEFNPQGSPLSPTATSGPPSGAPSGTPAQSGWAQTIYVTSSKGDNPRYIAFDPSGNVWLSDGTQSGTNTGVYEYAPGGTATAPTQGTLTDRSFTSAATDYNTYAIASDKFGNIWTSTYKKNTCATGTASTNTKSCEVLEMVPTAYTPYVTFSSSYSSQSPDSAGGSRGLAVDSSTKGTGNIWTTDINAAQAALFKTILVNGGAATASANGAAITLNTATDSTYGVALDKNSNAWIIGSTTGGLYEVNSSGTVVGTEALNSGFTTPAYDVIDGNNTVFVANVGSTTTNTAGVMQYSIANSSYLSPNFGFSPGATPVLTSSVVTSYSGASLYQPSYVAVDRSGALWVLNSGAYSSSTTTSGLVQILGVAGPTDPVLADGVYGTMP
jgi:hypothetical protein